jgi:hypothetical protein
MSTPERSQDPGGHGYGATEQDAVFEEGDAEHPLEDPDLDSRQDDEEEPAGERD